MNRYAFATVLSLLAITNLHASPPQAPIGQEISTKARAARFDAQPNDVVPFGGRQALVAEADLQNLTLEDAEKGAVLARLQTATGELHHVYVTKVGGEWKAYVETGGRVVAETNDVTVTTPDGGAETESRVVLRGVRVPKKRFCLRICILGFCRVFCL